MQELGVDALVRRHARVVVLDPPLAAALEARVVPTVCARPVVGDAMARSSYELAALGTAVGAAVGGTASRGDASCDAPSVVAAAVAGAWWRWSTRSSDTGVLRLSTTLGAEPASKRERWSSRTSGAPSSLCQPLPRDRAPVAARAAGPLTLF